MASNYDPSLNLATILQNLSSHTQQVQQLPSQGIPSLGQQASHSQSRYQYYPHTVHQSLLHQHNHSPSAASYLDSHAEGTKATLHNQHQERIPPRAESSAAHTDPRSLIEWSKGLRFVNKLASHDPSFASRVQKVLKLLLYRNG